MMKMIKLDETDRAIIRRVCRDIGESLLPYSEIAAELGLSEEELLRRLQMYKQEKVLRRFGTVLRHQKAGFTANGMSAWNVPDSDAERVGQHLAECSEVSHCYERQRFAGWDYNIYAMIHCRKEEECLSVAERLSSETGIGDYQVLFSVREFKKTSMVYFAE